MATKGTALATGGVPEDKDTAAAKKTYAPLMTAGTKALVKIRDVEKDIATAESDIDQAKYEQEKTRLKRTEEEEKKYADKTRGLYERAETQEQNYPFPTYKPTQEDALSYAQLGSMVITLGMMLGGGAKAAGKSALASMTGMINGWREGRQDLWRREAQQFDKDMQRIKSEREAIQKNLEKGLKLAATDRKAAQAAIDTAAHIAGEGVVKAMKNKGQLIPLANHLKQAYALEQKINESIISMAAAERRNRQQLASQEAQRQAMLQAAKEKASAPGRAGEHARTFASRMFGNILNASTDLINLTILPKTSESPLLAGLINTEPNTALGSIKAFVGRTITSPDSRAFDQITNSLDAALTRLEGQGVASAATQSLIKSFAALKPKAGDPAINMAIYIAKVKQEIETAVRVHKEMHGATGGQKSVAAQEIQKINKIIPFSVDDVLNVARGGRETLNEKMINLLQKQPIAQGVQYQGLSPLDVDATQQTDKSYPAASSRKAMPSGTKLTEYARTYFNGDESQAKQYLKTQGYE